MRRYCRILLIGLTCVLFHIAANCLKAVERAEIGLNAGWRFHLGEIPNAESSRFDDSTWPSVDVPHTWNAQDGQDGVTSQSAGPRGHDFFGDYVRSTGWYRRVLKPSAAWNGRRIYFQFDGAGRRTDLFVNGVLVGTHLGNFARFRFDVTEVLKREHDNIIAVRVNNEDNNIIPHNADFTFFGGLYRNVSILVTDPVQIETMDYGSPGVFLKQKKVSEESAEIDATVKLANHLTEGAEIFVNATVFDAAGGKCLSASTTKALVAGGTAEVTLPLKMESPHLWNGRADPYLYTVRVEVGTAGTVLDSVNQPLGLRYFRVDPNQGFFLNGKHLDLHGVSRHQDRLDKGWAISPEDDREDMAIISEMGCTAVRVAHYQQSPLWYELADRQGIVMWSEVPFVGAAFPGPFFYNNALEQMRELIRQNYNHPAICFWGVGNENGDSTQEFLNTMVEYAPVSEQLIQSLNAFCHAEDPTRLTTYASFHQEEDLKFPKPGASELTIIKGEPQRWYTDTTAFNKYFGWYVGEPEDAGTYFDSLHKRNPAQCIGVSEYGAGASIVQHALTNYDDPHRERTPMNARRSQASSKAHPEEYQAYYHEQTWKVLTARPYIWSKFIWNMFDFASDFRDEGDHPGRNDKGLVTYDRKTRKDAFYFYKANWGSEPVLYIASRRFTERTNPETEVKVYTNAADVELLVNGKSLGKLAAGSDHIVRWTHVELSPGANHIRIVAQVDGRPLEDSCTWQLTPTAPAPASLPGNPLMPSTK